MIMPLIRCSLLSKDIYLFEYQIIKYMNNFKANDNKILEALTTITKREQLLKQKK